jgi:hypothetical protein
VPASVILRMATTPPPASGTPAPSPTRHGAVVWGWLDSTIFDLGRQMRWSYLPPLMVYVAYGISGLTGIVTTFYVKERLGLSAAFLAGLAFWLGVPWTLKMPLGHLVDLIWRWKAALVYLGAALVAASLLIMYGVIAHTSAMTAILSAEAWFVISSLLAPVGYVVQDTVADAMTVEAVPTHDEHGQPYPESAIKTMHTTMQTLGRIALIGGLALVAGINIWIFAGVEAMSDEAKNDLYASVYLYSLVIPAVSILGVTLGAIDTRRRAAKLRRQGVSAEQAKPQGDKVNVNWWILGGGAAFVIFTLATGLSGIPFDQEIIFAGSMIIVMFLMRQLILELDASVRLALVGTAVIIFVFRATPLAGDGATWWQIDVLGFDQQFFAVLSFITSALTLLGMIVLRPMIARRTIVDIVIILTVVSGILSLPSIGLYYDLHKWTERLTGGIVDARFIMLINTALESPLGQVAMIPMLAWIAKNAPAHLRATFFAVMASFTNLALSASSLLTRYLNEIFVVTRQVRDQAGAVTTPQDYSQLGWLFITVTALTVLMPLIAIAIVQVSRLRTPE